MFFLGLIRRIAVAQLFKSFGERLGFVKTHLNVGTYIGYGK